MIKDSYLQIMLSLFDKSDLVLLDHRFRTWDTVHQYTTQQPDDDLQMSGVWGLRQTVSLWPAV